MTRSLLLALLFVAGSQAWAGGATRRFLVSFEAASSSGERRVALKSLGATAVEELGELDAVVAEVPDTGAVVTAFQEAASLEPSIAFLEEDVYLKWIEGAEALPAFGIDAGVIRTMLEGVRLGETAPSLPPGVDAAEVPWGITRVNAPAAWARSMGDGVKVAVIDTGIDASHPDLRGAVAGGYNAFDSDKPAFDDNGHGTHVSGTIAAALDAKGVVGVAPKARLYAVKVLDKNGGGRLSSVVKGIVWAGRNGMQVANMSLGAPMGSLFMRGAVMYAAHKGVAVIAAAGNNGKRVEYPAGYPDAIAVSAMDGKDKIAGFSSRGSKVEFIAPGVSVRSSVPGGGYDSHSGTSMATPHVAGLAAIAVSRGAKGPDGVRAALKRAARPVEGLKKEEQGHGVVDAALLVR